MKAYASCPIRGYAMIRFRLSTPMLLIVIVALGVALVMQRRREAELQTRLAQSWPLFLKLQKTEDKIQQLVKFATQYQHLIEQLEQRAENAQRQTE